jgi:hypothetical protein
MAVSGGKGCCWAAGFSRGAYGYISPAESGLMALLSGPERCAGLAPCLPCRSQDVDHRYDSTDRDVS